MLCACCVDTRSPTERGSDTGEDLIAHRPLPIKSLRSEGSPAPFPAGVTNICAHSQNPLLSTATCQPGANETTGVPMLISGGILEGCFNRKPDMGVWLFKSVKVILTYTCKWSMSFLSIWQIVVIVNLAENQEMKRRKSVMILIITKEKKQVDLTNLL